MARRPVYKSEKRKKEVMRLKKQEEKRQKRFNKAGSPEGGESQAPTPEISGEAQGNAEPSV